MIFDRVLRFYYDVNALWGRFFPLFLIILTIFSGVSTFFLIGQKDLMGYETAIFFFLSLDLLLSLLLVLMVLNRVIVLWTERRKGLAGSALHVRISLLFAMVAFAPTLVAFFSMFSFNLGLEKQFLKPLSITISDSLVIANQYLEEHKTQIKSDIYTLKRSLERLPKHFTLGQALSSQIELRGLTEGIIITDNFKVLARSELTFAIEFEKIPEAEWKKAQKGDVAIFINPDQKYIRALLKLKNGTYLYLGRAVFPKIIDRIQKIEKNVDEHHKEKDGRLSFQISFFLFYIIVSALLILAAVWVGLIFSASLSRPIRKLIIAAEKIRLGDIRTLVEVDEKHPELGTLARAFNRMLEQIGLQSQSLIEHNVTLNEQNNFIKAVLQGVTAGVISVNEYGVIELMNPSAEKILEMSYGEVQGTYIQKTLPFFTELFERSKNSDLLVLTTNILFNRQSHAVTLAVKLSKDIEESNTKYIFTFDNISELVSAQRKAAWSDVARRIAHEIKNPLTPIQLSAERIKRKYSVQISSDKDIFENCISTIVAHVEQIGSMVDEFANFAKMPSAKLEKKDISSLITQVVALQKMAHTNVSYIWEPQDEECLLMLDKNLFTQGLTNLLLNAYESFEGLADQDLSIRILLIRQESQLIVCIEDNGKGLPKENREKLTEPYITTRVKGTGLGLAIVKHIMEEHKGDLRLGDSVDLKGAKIEMIFQDQLLSL